jgi:NTP pyrophosphatase (non-canonical NTP hydrolase)
MAMSKWVPTTNLLELRRLGKLGEELGELSNVASRCIIQGLDEVDPGTGKVNRLRLLDELADVQAQIECTLTAFGLDLEYFHQRSARKVDQMHEWEALFASPKAALSPEVERDAARELTLRELHSIGRSYFNGPLNSNEEMFGRAVERVVRQRLTAAAVRDLQLRQMVNRFLGWKLPRTFSPDAGIKFTPSNGMTREEAYDKPGWWPIGTNLLTADEARAMLEYVLAHDQDRAAMNTPTAKEPK